MQLGKFLFKRSNQNRNESSLFSQYSKSKFKIRILTILDFEIVKDFKSCPTMIKIINQLTVAFVRSPRAYLRQLHPFLITFGRVIARPLLREGIVMQRKSRKHCSGYINVKKKTVSCSISWNLNQMFGHPPPPYSYSIAI